MKVSVEDASPHHLPPIMDDIRPADIREWYAASGNPDIEYHLRDTFSSGLYARSALSPEGLLLCMWGAIERRPGVASVWLFATCTAERHAVSIHRHLRRELDAILKQWPTLIAWADSRNTVHHTWLQWLGFRLETEDFMGPLGMPFKKYVRSAECA